MKILKNKVYICSCAVEIESINKAKSLFFKISKNITQSFLNHILLKNNSL